VIFGGGGLLREIRELGGGKYGNLWISHEVFCLKNLKERNYLENLGVDSVITRKIKMDFRMTVEVFELVPCR
jgi:hypothetical protein